MLYSINELTKFFFLDIETISEYKSLDDAPIPYKKIWMKKHHLKFLEKEIQARKEKLFLESLEDGTCLYQNIADVELKQTITPDEIYIQYSPLHAEFSKVLCLSMGEIDRNRNIENVVLYEENEKDILLQLSSHLSSHKDTNLAGYNVKGFDIPYLIKRMLILNIPLPIQLQLRGKKPWEVFILDIAEDWKGLNFTMVSLETLCIALGIETSKGEFDGGEMGPLLHAGKITIEQVKEYCFKDNYKNMEIVLRFCKP